MYSGLAIVFSYCSCIFFLVLHLLKKEKSHYNKYMIVKRLFEVVNFVATTHPMG